MPDPWRNRKTVRITAVIDMLFALFTMTVYVVRIMFDNTQEDGTLRGFLRPNENIIVTVTLWTIAFTINFLQLIIAYLLFSITKKGKNESAASIVRTRYWLVISNAIFVILISKFIYFIFFDKGKDSVVRIFILILCIGELFFKGYAMYFVKDFRDDLKSAFSSPAGKVQFISVMNNSGSRKSQTETTSIV